MGAFREQVLELLGPKPEQCDLDPVVESSEDLGYFVRQRVTYMVEPGDRVPAYLFVPKTGPDLQKRPAVFAHHQHASQYNLGKSEVAGITNKDGELGDPDQAYALELAKRGYVVLAPDALCFEERVSDHPNLKDFYFERFSLNDRLPFGACLQTKLLWDMQRGLDYLETRPEVDAQRLGCIGHSLGGQQTLFLSALDERIKVGVSSCGFSSYEAISRIRRNHNLGLYVPGIRRDGRDIGDLLAEVSPRPFLSVSGENDPIFPIDGVNDSVNKARIKYEEEDKSPFKLVLKTYPVGHEFTHEMRQEAYKFFDKWL